MNPVHLSDWPNAVDMAALTAFFSLAIALPALGYFFMILDFRAYLRSLRRGLVCVVRYLPDLPDWTRFHTPRCIAVLGLQVPCSEDDLKRAYREKVKRLHPDRGGDKRQFLLLQACFEEALPLLADPHSPYRARGTSAAKT